MGTYPKEKNNSSKEELILHGLGGVLSPPSKGLVHWTIPLWDRPASYQVVGEVTAHQADDG